MSLRKRVLTEKAAAALEESAAKRPRVSLNGKTTSSQTQQTLSKSQTPAPDVITPAVSNPSLSAARPAPATAPPTTRPDQRARVEEIPDEEDNRAAAQGNEAESESESEDEDAQLSRMKQKMSSPIYSFYRETIAIVYVDGRRVHEFRCAKPSCTQKPIRRYLDTPDAMSTGNLRKHAKACWGADAVAAADGLGNVKDARQHVETLGRTGLITEAFKRQAGSKVTYSTRQYTPMQSRLHTVRWVCESTRPFSIVEDPEYRNLMKTGRPEYPITSAKTLARDVRRVFVNARARLAKDFQILEGAISYGTDCWTAPNKRPYLALFASYPKDGKRVILPLDVAEVADSHTGERLATEIHRIINEFEADDKMLGMTADNASNNDSLIDELEGLSGSFEGRASQVRCFAHIINLIAKTILHQFEISSKPSDNTADETMAQVLADLAAGLDLEGIVSSAIDLSDNHDGAEDDLDEDSDDEGDVDDDVDGWVDERTDLSKEQREELRESVLPLKLALAKIRKLSNTIINSTTKLLPLWKKLLKNLRRVVRHMPRDVATRWNSTFVLLNFAIDYREAVDKFTDDRATNLRNLELKEDEWVLLTQLRDVLKVLYDATLYVSRGGEVNLHLVIPAMDMIDETLTNHSLNEAFEPAIRVACALGKKCLNRYYNRTDESNMYRIAMILHPEFKLQYFKNAEWKEEWITTAKEIIRAEWDNKWSHMDEDGDVKEVNEATPSANVFDNIPAVMALQHSIVAPPVNPLELYMSAPCESVNKDPLGWWSTHGRRQYGKRMMLMAQSYLCAPATTVDVERFFSRGRILLSHIRNRLSAESTRALLLVGAWSRLGLIQDEDILAVTSQPYKSNGSDDDNVAAGWDEIVIASN